MNIKHLKNFLKLSFWDKILILTEVSYNKIQKYLNFRGKYNLLIDNRKDYHDLLIIVAGYQDYLYDKVLNRVNKYMEKNIDVCVVSPGKKDLKLIEYCKNFGWSYLYTKDNKLALAQNLAIKIHPNAEFVYKMDEDIFITKGFFSKLKEKYILSCDISEFNPGGIAPVININAFTYSYFLSTINKREDFVKKFGKLKQDACYQIRQENIRYSGKIARYLWENSLNIDDVQKKYFDKIDISRNFISNSVCFSIGCFMFKRNLREDLNSGGGFKVSIDGELAKEEQQFLSYGVWKSKPIIMCENCLVGHFGFGPQKQEMKKFFEDNIDLF